MVKKYYTRPPAYGFISHDGEILPLAFDSPLNPRCKIFCDTYGIRNLIQVKVLPVLKNGRIVRMTENRIADYKQRAMQRKNPQKEKVPCNAKT